MEKFNLFGVNQSIINITGIEYIKWENGSLDIFSNNSGINCKYVYTINADLCETLDDTVVYFEVNDEHCLAKFSNELNSIQRQELKDYCDEYGFNFEYTVSYMDKQEAIQLIIK